MKLSSVLKVPAIAGLVLAAGISLAPSLQAEALTEEQLKVLQNCTTNLKKLNKKIDEFLASAKKWESASSAVDKGKAGDKSDDDEAKKVFTNYKDLDKLLTEYKNECKQFDDIAKESQK